MKKKNLFFNLHFTFSSHQGKDTKIPSTHISHLTEKNTYLARPIDFLAY